MYQTIVDLEQSVGVSVGVASDVPGLQRALLVPVLVDVTDTGAAPINGVTTVDTVFSEC